MELVTIAGDLLTTIITNDSLTRLGLNEGTLITAEVKAPWVILQKDGNEPICTAENFGGPLTASLRVRSPLSTWFVLPMGRNSALWLTSESSRRLDLHANDPVWAVFNSFSVVLHID